MSGSVGVIGTVGTVDDGGDHDAVYLLKQEMEALEDSFDSTLSVIDSLIKFYSVDPSNEEGLEQMKKSLDKLSEDPLKVSRLSGEIFQYEKKYQWEYRSKLGEYQELNKSSFDKVSGNLETIYDQHLKNLTIQSLESKLDDVDSSLKLEDSSQVLSLDHLSKEQLLKMIEVEKTKRFKNTLINEKVLEPSIKKLEIQFDEWNNRDQELNKFLQVDLENINKKIQQVKKIESLDI